MVIMNIKDLFKISVSYFISRPLKDSCGLSYVNYVFDNNLTVIFAFFMSLWGKYFIKFVFFRTF